VAGSVELRPRAVRRVPALAPAHCCVSCCWTRCSGRDTPHRRRIHRERAGHFSPRAPRRSQRAARRFRRLRARFRHTGRARRST